MNHNDAFEKYKSVSSFRRLKLNKTQIKKKDKCENLHKNPVFSTVPPAPGSPLLSDTYVYISYITHLIRK